jgi:secondary thiamine-phosphate synthase enzyme
MERFSVETHRRTELIDITAQVERAVRASGVKEGVAHLFALHTTAGITINENADPTVVQDVLAALERAVPQEAGYRHGEGNSPAHVKSSLMGCNQTVPVEGGRLVLGTWQAIYFCEFDGPRTRTVAVQVSGTP